MKNSIRKLFALMGASLLMGASDKNVELGPPPQQIASGPKPTASQKRPNKRNLTLFNVKGHKIMAYSRKDAITRLKHKKLI